VTLILLYLVVLILVAIVLFGVGSVLFGRGERLPPLPRATTATALPASEVTGADVEALKFSQTLRGYKAGEVDWVLDRLGQELDQLRGQVAALRAAYGVDDFVPDSDSGLDTDYETEVDDDQDDAAADGVHRHGAHAVPAEGREEQ
jgi:DivIVA domain-containing protein